jgi:DNA polymerase elongation subunit (family B)
MVKPKILIFDIENSMQKVEFLGFPSTKYPTRIQPQWIQGPQKIHCIGYKWLGDKKANVISVHDFKSAFKKDHMNDINVLTEFNKILKTADAVIGHNMKSFDLKHINTRIMMNKLEPMILPHPIDTLLLSRSNFNLSSHKLDELARALKLEVRKSPMCRQDWIDCYNGDLKAFKKMAKYCKQDIQLTEAVYNELYPYVENHPKISRIMGSTNQESYHICPVCNSKDNVKQGTRGTTTGKKQIRKCKDCGKVFLGEILL